MTPAHGHSASVNFDSVGNLSELFGNGSLGSEYGQVQQYSPLNGMGGNGLRYCTPLNALQLANGELVPYDQQDLLISGVERLNLNSLPVRVLVPTYSYLQDGENNPGRSYYGDNRGRGRFSRHKNHRSEDFDVRGRGAGGGYRPRGPAPGRGGSRKSRGVQKELKDNVRRTIYISDIDQMVTEEELATFFSDGGQIIDCRVCGDPNSAKRFAFIEFLDTEGATKALEKSGSMMGTCSIRVLPSKTAIVPVNKDFMPKNMEEMELCSRTVYVANIDKKVDKHDVKRFFEGLCGKVTKLRLLGDYAHSTRIAFVEFTVAESALAALNCSGAVLGTLPIRVSPSKAPVRMCSASDCED